MAHMQGLLKKSTIVLAMSALTFSSTAFAENAGDKGSPTASARMVERAKSLQEDFRFLQEQFAMIDQNAGGDAKKYEEKDILKLQTQLAKLKAELAKAGLSAVRAERDKTKWDLMASQIQSDIAETQVQIKSMGKTSEDMQRQAEATRKQVEVAQEQFNRTKEKTDSSFKESLAAKDKFEAELKTLNELLKQYAVETPKLQAKMAKYDTDRRMFEQVIAETRMKVKAAESARAKAFADVEIAKKKTESLQDSYDTEVARSEAEAARLEADKVKAELEAMKVTESNSALYAQIEKQKGSRNLAAAMGCPLRSSASEDGEVVTQFAPGEKFKVQYAESGWYSARHGSGKSGYMAVSCFGKDSGRLPASQGDGENRKKKKKGESSASTSKELPKELPGFKDRS